ncbi:MAG: GldG family protein [Oscillospiraceae bacterium]|nr:GldG family protein [Oscillospiraceae bacterium]
MKNNLALRGGSYSLVITAVVLAILIVFNLFVSVLPSTWTKLDISSSQLYSVTSNTKVVVNNLEQDVTIYWIVQADKEDDILENLLAKYESLSDHITVVKKNPDTYPTFTEQYTDEDVPNNSLIVECGDRSRYISNSDIYEYEIDYYTYQAYAESFDGEGAITSAIDYVVSEDLPQLYLLEGHGEGDLPETFADQIEKANMETQSFSLLTVEAVPDEADCVLIYAPASDISTDEAEKLADYVAGGGKLMVVSGPLEDGGLTNLNTLLERYGVTVNEGIVVENDSDHFFYGYPYLLLPEINSADITDSLIAEKYNVLMSVAAGLTVSGESGAGTVTALLTTSDSAFSKTAGYNLTTYEKEEGDIDGPFALAVSIEDNSGGSLIWFSSSDFLEEQVNAYSSGANCDLAMNALSAMIGESEAITIRSKSLNYNYLTISDSTSSLLKVLMVGVIPLAFLGVGVCVVLQKRRRQNESV